MGTFGIGNAKARTTVVAGIKFSQVPGQVSLATVLIDALHAALEHAPDVLDGVGVDVATDVFILGVNDCVVFRELFASLGVNAALVGMQH
jgi:hypothetical protein